MAKVVVESPLVNSLFTCTLCHGLIRSPTVINECLHRCTFPSSVHRSQSKQNLFLPLLQSVNYASQIISRKRPLTINVRHVK